MKTLTKSLLAAAQTVLKSRVNGEKIDLYEIRFLYRGKVFKIVETDTANHWRLLQLPYSGACAFSYFSEFDYNPFL